MFPGGVGELVGEYYDIANWINQKLTLISFFKYVCIHPWCKYDYEYRTKEYLNKNEFQIHQSFETSNELLACNIKKLENTLVLKISARKYKTFVFNEHHALKINSMNIFELQLENCFFSTEFLSIIKWPSFVTLKDCSSAFQNNMSEKPIHIMYGVHYLQCEKNTDLHIKFQADDAVCVRFHINDKTNVASKSAQTIIINDQDPFKSFFYECQVTKFNMTEMESRFPAAENLVVYESTLAPMHLKSQKRWKNVEVHEHRSHHTDDRTFSLYDLHADHFELFGGSTSSLRCIRFPHQIQNEKEIETVHKKEIQILLKNETRKSDDLLFSHANNYHSTQKVHDFTMVTSATNCLLAFGVKDPCEIIVEKDGAKHCSWCFSRILKRHFSADDSCNTRYISREKHDGK
jgi:hypothetical protein